MNSLCLGKCGSIGNYIMKNGNRWCSKYPVNCPSISKIRAENISKAKLKLSKMGLNPMQNPEICRKNHSLERNKKASETLRKLGKLGLLPQQTESKQLKYKRRKNVSRTLRQMLKEGRHPRQLETTEKRKERINKMAETLRMLGNEGKLPIQNMSYKEKKLFGKKISKTLRMRIRKGLIKPYNSYGKRIAYISPISGNLILRSYWEKEMANHLDDLNIKWMYEPFVISYWNRERKLNANTIPDFYIPKYNLIIEVKGSDFDSSETRDKIKGIKKAGYNVILIGRKLLEKIHSGKITLDILIKNGDNYS